MVRFRRWATVGAIALTVAMTSATAAHAAGGDNVASTPGAEVIALAPDSEIAKVVASVSDQPDRSSGTSSGRAVAASGCATLTITVTGYTALGFVAYRFHSRQGRCWNGLQVTSLYDRAQWVTEVDPLQYDNGANSDWVEPAPRTQVHSFAQRRIDNCVPVWGCVSTRYPTIEMWLKNNGTYTYAARAE